MLYRKINSFKKIQRIPRSEGYTDCFHSIAVEKQQFKVYYRANVLTHARLGVVAPKRIQNLSVDRNKSKRTIREAFRVHPISGKSLDLVVILRRGSSENENRLEVLAGIFSLIEARCAVS